MDRYYERIASIGLTRRQRAVNHQRDYFYRRLPESISYKEVELNGVPTHLIVDKDTKPYYKKYRSLISTDPDYVKPKVGDYVKWAGAMWLIMNADSDDELYVDGQMYQCNYLLRWQNPSGKIIERWVHVDGRIRLERLLSVGFMLITLRRITLVSITINSLRLPVIR